MVRCLAVRWEVSPVVLRVLPVVPVPVRHPAGALEQLAVAR